MHSHSIQLPRRPSGLLYYEPSRWTSNTHKTCPTKLLTNELTHTNTLLQSSDPLINNHVSSMESSRALFSSMGRSIHQGYILTEEKIMHSHHLISLKANIQRIPKCNLRRFLVRFVPKAAVYCPRFRDKLGSKPTPDYSFSSISNLFPTRRFSGLSDSLFTVSRT